MTDRIHSLTVVLEQDIRTDDVETIINAIRAIRFVGSVEKHVADLETHSARERVRLELGQKILDVIYPKRPKI